MEFSSPSTADASTIRDVAYRSIRASYAISPEEIEAMLEQWFDEERLAEQIDGSENRYLVAKREGEIVGFAAGRLEEADEAGVVEWVHVDPNERGQEAGTQLFERMREELAGRGAERVHARVFELNTEGSMFLERFDMTIVEEDQLEIDGSPFVVNVYGEEGEVEGGDGAIGDGRSDPEELPDHVETDEGTFAVAQEEVQAGTNGPFLLAYADEDAEDLAGYYCTNCGTLVETMGGQGRIECETCGNVHRPEEWDDAYL